MKKVFEMYLREEVGTVCGSNKEDN